MMARCCLAAALGVTLLVAAILPAAAKSPTVHPLVGAYYYLWNPENFAGGTLRAHLVPPQLPAGSLVNSRSPKTAARDITNARKAGINFFAIDWWPDDPGYSGEDYQGADDAMQSFLKAPNISQMRFAMFYETWNLGFDAGRESTPVTFQMELHFDADMASFAKNYFHNKSYLRIDGRPVVFLYLSRTLTGDVAGMIQGARTVLKRLGYNPYFIGDEVYWRVTPENPNPAGPLLTTTPQVNRIEQFDAITSYILYYGDPDWLLGPTEDFTGYPGTTNIVADERHLLNEYSAATDGRVPVVPDIASSFNDRGFRLPTNHPAQPRQWLPSEGPASTLDHLFRCVAIPEVSPTLPMVMVTSWDDWNEDTGIEPIGGTPTDVDNSPSGKAYTQGYTYGGEGRKALTVLRADVNQLDRRFAASADGRTVPAKDASQSSSCR
jgi:glycoprotein endo-alpha-1,2-mannosidase